MAGDDDGKRSRRGPRSLGVLSDREIASMLSMQYRIPTINLAEYEVAPDIVALVPESVCKTFSVMPVSRAGNALIVAVSDPSGATSDERDALLAELTGLTIEKVIAPDADIRIAIRRYHDVAKA